MLCVRMFLRLQPASPTDDSWKLRARTQHTNPTVLHRGKSQHSYFDNSQVLFNRGIRRQIRFSSWHIHHSYKIFSEGEHFKIREHFSDFWLGRRNIDVRLEAPTQCHRQPGRAQIDFSWMNIEDRRT